MLLEASWEVCNKVGGIHTVVTSKLFYARTHLGGGYLAIGPSLSEYVESFREEAHPEWMLPILAGLAEQGVRVRYGVWVGDGQDAPTVLIDWSGLVNRRDELKARFWSESGLDTMGTDFYDFDQPLLWGAAVGMFAQALSATQPVLLQAHEWLSAGAFLTCSTGPALHTVFTTHATVLGRALASHGRVATDEPNLNPTAEARALGVFAKHQLEQLGATKANVFTTVSSITAAEAEKVLGVPVAITENAMGAELLIPLDQLSALRSEVRSELQDVLAATHFPTGSFDLDKVYHIFTMGRPETHAKGYDRLLQALGTLNTSLKEQGSSRTIAAWFLVPTGATRIRPASQGQLLVYERLEELLTINAKATAPNWYASFMAEAAEQEIPEFLTQDGLAPQHQHLAEALLNRLVHPVEAFYSPFEINNEENDQIINLSRQYGLGNKAEDRVKILYMPVYLEGLDGILNRPLTQIIPAFDLGVFPSFYEPWGYTPMESIAGGVPAITTNYTGFGVAAAKGSGVEAVDVLERGLDEDGFSNVLTEHILEACKELPMVRERHRLAALQLRHRFTWNERYSAYRAAYSKALAA